MPLTQVDQGLLGSNAQYTGFKNRILNGSMILDQRNGGAVVANLNGLSSSYFLDRWQLYCSNNSTGNASVQQSTVAPAGFKNSLLVTVTAAQASLGASFYSMAWQKIEGFNVADLGWGASGAQTVTLSFQVRSSVTGLFGGSILNQTQDRCYPFSYTITAANTWETKTVTIPGDTTGTWATGNTTGVIVNFGIAVGSTYGSGTANAWAASAAYTVSGATNLYATNGNTWQITGVQLEKGSTATSFDYRPYGTELQLCQRYFETYAMNNTSLIGNSTSGTGGSAVLSWHVPKRTAPSVTLPAAGNSSGTVSFLTAGGAYPATVGTNTAADITVDKATINGSGYSGLTVGGASIFWSSGTSTIQISAEL